MLEPFLHFALAAGVGLSLVTGPIGSIVVWRRMAFFGDTVAHSALTGVALSLFFSINILIGLVLVPFLIAVIMTLTLRKRWLASDTWLAIAAHGILAVGLVALSFVSGITINLESYLFGDILAVSSTDLALIYSISLVILISITLIWRPLLSMTINEDLAAVEGVNTIFIHTILMVLIASLVAIAINLVGVLLLTALLIIPAATARRFANSPEKMALFASAVGICAVFVGVYASLYLNTPTAPSIVVAALIFFLVSIVLPIRTK